MTALTFKVNLMNQIQVVWHKNLTTVNRTHRQNRRKEKKRKLSKKA